jgi:murein endopeptidase
LAIARATGENFAVRSLWVLVLLGGTAQAERYVIQKGETLQHVADAHGCSVEAVQRANELRTTLVKPGTRIVLPSCSIRARAQTRTRTRNDDDKAREALAVIDGATWVEPTPARKRGPLVDAEQMPRGEGYNLRRPELAFGVPHVVDHLRHCIAEVRALYPDVHTLAIGDISAEHGGKLDGHVSHRSGLDVDVGFYFKQQPDGYPQHFAAADDNLDLQATWALLTAFARTSDLDDGVSIMFVDYALQKRLYKWAQRRGTPEADLESLFQYPHAKDAQIGLIRHWPKHADHVHVRFKRQR